MQAAPKIRWFPIFSNIFQYGFHSSDQTSGHVNEYGSMKKSFFIFLFFSSPYMHIAGLMRDGAAAGGWPRLTKQQCHQQRLSSLLFATSLLFGAHPFAVGPARQVDASPGCLANTGDGARYSWAAGILACWQGLTNLTSAFRGKL